MQGKNEAARVQPNAQGEERPGTVQYWCQCLNLCLTLSNAPPASAALSTEEKKDLKLAGLHKGRLCVVVSKPHAQHVALLGRAPCPKPWCLVTCRNCDMPCYGTCAPISLKPGKENLVVVSANLISGADVFARRGGRMFSSAFRIVIPPRCDRPEAMNNLPPGWLMAATQQARASRSGGGDTRASWFNAGFGSLVSRANPANITSHLSAPLVKFARRTIERERRTTAEAIRTFTLQREEELRYFEAKLENELLALSLQGLSRDDQDTFAVPGDDENDSPLFPFGSPPKSQDVPDALTLWDGEHVLRQAFSHKPGEETLFAFDEEQVDRRHSYRTRGNAPRGFDSDSDSQRGRGDHGRDDDDEADDDDADSDGLAGGRRRQEQTLGSDSEDSIDSVNAGYARSLPVAINNGSNTWARRPPRREKENSFIPPHTFVDSQFFNKKTDEDEQEHFERSVRYQSRPSGVHLPATMV